MEQVSTNLKLLIEQKVEVIESYRLRKVKQVLFLITFLVFIYLPVAYHYYDLSYDLGVHNKYFAFANTTLWTIIIACGFLVSYFVKFYKNEIIKEVIEYTGKFKYCEHRGLFGHRHLKKYSIMPKYTGISREDFITSKLNNIEFKTYEAESYLHKFDLFSKNLTNIVQAFKGSVVELNMPYHFKDHIILTNADWTFTKLLNHTKKYKLKEIELNNLDIIEDYKLYTNNIDNSDHILSILNEDFFKIVNTTDKKLRSHKSEFLKNSLTKGLRLEIKDNRVLLLLGHSKDLFKTPKFFRKFNKSPYIEEYIDDIEFILSVVKDLDKHVFSKLEKR